MSILPLDEGRTERRCGAVAERRLRPPQVTPRAHLEQLPAMVLLHRLPIPMLAVGCDGDVVYANPAFAAMLGRPGETTELSLCDLLVGYRGASARTCAAVLSGAAGTVVEWCHADGYRLQTVVSDSLLARAGDPLLLIALTDVTDVLWHTRA